MEIPKVGVEGGTSREGHAGVLSVAVGQTLLPGLHWYQCVGLVDCIFFICRNRTREGASVAQSNTAG